MHRSGSTLVWQIARNLLDGTPGLRNPRGVPVAEYAPAAANPDDLLMAKVHFRPSLDRAAFPQEGARYLYTYRDPRDVVASLYRKGRAKPGDPERGARNSRLIVRRELRGDEFWTSRKDVWIGRYEDFRDDVPGLVRALAQYLQVEVDDARVAGIVADVDLAAQAERARAAKEQGVDDDLRVTSNHITDGREGAWRDTLTSDELVAIEAESARWLAEHGYSVETQVGRRRTRDLPVQGTAAPLRSPAPVAAARPSDRGAGKPRTGRGTPASRPASVTATARKRTSGAHRAPEPDTAAPLEITGPVLAATAFGVAGILSRHRNPGAAALLWGAAAAFAAVGAYRMGRDAVAPHEVVAGITALGRQVRSARRPRPTLRVA